MKSIEINILLSFLLCVCMLAGCSSDTSEKKEVLAEERASQDIQLVRNQRDSMEQVIYNTLDEIDDNLMEIRKKENSVRNKMDIPMHSVTEAKESVLENIQAINTLLDNNKQKINALQHQLAAVQHDNARLNKLISYGAQAIQQRAKEVEERDAQLSKIKEVLMEQNFTIGELNKRIDTLQDNNNELRGRSLQLEADLNTAYFAEGTKRELRDKGVLKKVGGILGAGATEVLCDNYPPNMFAKIDIRKVSSIPLRVKKAKLVTPHPEGSYTFKMENGTVASLEITEPDQFWRAGRHMVIEEIR